MRKGRSLHRSDSWVAIFCTDVQTKGLALISNEMRVEHLEPLSSYGSRFIPLVLKDLGILFEKGRAFRVRIEEQKIMLLEGKRFFSFQIDGRCSKGFLEEVSRPLKGKIRYQRI